ncbi:Uncharacterized protein MCB1EB_0406 [Mycoavidus cysteinexigens]|uniref:Putative tail fiber protein gp53-like C-terminal domain-containing protein n=1 Tax=Mycoavidus cysteinexigens TaxID=1553431 RepID=A0A2Z6ET32_9BURK|nr:hypothetical protein [Mycoavidus cysteinexigens]BBE08567.1 Uncharacterized protein MCB1EB_0406 [Mycoavidus cysteinexigens]GAM52730.1 phage tail fibers [bacterium endosymbiont of Mortierella elongata FMR23-6]GLR00418.1 hypothetical protein GCM10007934_02290 [Mycoavidus cysteinexigens]
MTLYQRPDEHVFAEGARPGEVQPFPDLSRGWGVAFDQTGGIPPMEWFNFIGKRADEAIRYLMQRGLPEWSETEDYPEGSYIQYSGKTYRAKIDNKGKTPSAHLAEWEEWGLTRKALDAHFHPKEGELAWPKITETPTTLDGYGITDAATAQDVQSQFSKLQLHWQKISNTPSTVSGYGITDAAPIKSPAFVGSPTAPTHHDPRNHSNQLASTAFTQNAISAAFTGHNQQKLERIEGYQKLPGGFILQWGQLGADTAGNIHIIFPTPFSRACFGVYGIHIGAGPVIVIEVSGTRSNTGIVLRTFDTDGRTAAWPTQWFAIGR